MKKKDVYNAISDKEYSLMQNKMLAMKLYLLSQGKQVATGEELYRITRKFEEMLEVMELVGEINIKVLTK